MREVKNSFLILKVLLSSRDEYRERARNAKSEERKERKKRQGMTRVNSNERKQLITLVLEESHPSALLHLAASLESFSDFFFG